MDKQICYQEAKSIIGERVAQTQNNIGAFDLYSMIFAEDLQVVINMIDELELATEDEKLTWNYGYLLGQALGSLDSSESILHYFKTTMGQDAEILSAVFLALEARLISLHPENNA